MSRTFTKRARLIDAVLEAGRHLSTATLLFHHAVAERLGLHPTDHKCLGLLHETGSMTAGELAEVTRLSTGAITGVIDRLEDKGFVRREQDPSDRRRVIVRPIMENAKREVVPLFESLAKAMARLARTYSDRDLDLVREYMDRARTVLEQEAARLRKA